jgi:hypothetical protein
MSATPPTTWGVDADICLDAGDTTDPTKPEEPKVTRILPGVSGHVPVSPAARSAASILERRRPTHLKPKEDPMPTGVYDRSLAKPRRGRPPKSQTPEPSRPVPSRPVLTGGKLAELIEKLRAERDELDALIDQLERIAKG